MANLRKLLARALTGANLFDDPNREVAVDRLRAHAHSDPLGAALWALRWANNAGRYDEALQLLHQKLTRTHKRADRKMMHTVCRVALDEWLRDVCPGCKGRRYIQATALAAAHACSQCGGSGLAQISDDARIGKLKISPKAYPFWERKIYEAHQRISEADTRAWTQMAAWLGHSVSPLAEKQLLEIAKEQRRIAHVSDIEDSDVPAHSNNNMPAPYVSSSATT